MRPVWIELTESQDDAKLDYCDTADAGGHATNACGPLDCLCRLRAAGPVYAATVLEQCYRRDDVGERTANCSNGGAILIAPWSRARPGQAEGNAKIADPPTPDSIKGSRSRVVRGCSKEYVLSHSMLSVGPNAGRVFQRGPLRSARHSLRRLGARVCG